MSPLWSQLMLQAAQTLSAGCCCLLRGHGMSSCSSGALQQPPGCLRMQATWQPSSTWCCPTPQVKPGPAHRPTTMQGLGCVPAPHVLQCPRGQLPGRQSSWALGCQTLGPCTQAGCLGQKGAADQCTPPQMGSVLAARSTLPDHELTLAGDSSDLLQPDCCEVHAGCVRPSVWDGLLQSAAVRRQCAAGQGLKTLGSLPCSLQNVERLGASSAAWSVLKLSWL